MHMQERRQPKEWWQALKRLIPENNKGKISETRITNKDWLDHFQHLLAPKITKKNEETDGQDTQGKAKVDGRFLHLDDPVRMEEVSKVVKRLNEGKATFFDNVDNTIIKCLHAAQLDILSRLFSIILKSGNFPQEWAKAYLSLLHRKGSKHEP